MIFCSLPGRCNTPTRDGDGAHLGAYTGWVPTERSPRPPLCRHRNFSWKEGAKRAGEAADCRSCEKSKWLQSHQESTLSFSCVGALSTGEQGDLEVQRPWRSRDPGGPQTLESALAEATACRSDGSLCHTAQVHPSLTLLLCSEPASSSAIYICVSVGR